MSNYDTSTTLSLFITGDTDTTGTVTIPGQEAPVSFTVTAGQVTTVTLPTPATSQILTGDTVASLGIHIVANHDVTVYGLNYIQYSTDAFLALPTSALGKEYLVMAFPATISSLGSEFAIVGTEDSTTVTITPTATAGTHESGTPFVITLNQGQTYELQAIGQDVDLSGSLIVADKPVAVYGGNACADVPSSSYAACNHLVEELPPTDAWGKSFFTEPLATRQNGDTFRFLGSVDGTTVYANGETLTTLNRGAVYQTILSAATQITADQPILMVQLSNGSGYDGVSADPYMMLVAPYEQYLSSYVITTPSTGFSPNYVNLIAPTAGISSITVDGVAVDSTLFSQIGSSSYSGAQVPISVGSHALSGSVPFGVISYGYASYDGYGYIGGFSLSPVASVSSVSLSSESSSAHVGDSACVSATVTDSNGNGLSGVRVDYVVTGANSASGSAATNASGVAQYCYAGGNSGTDTVTGTVSGVSGETTITWRAGMGLSPSDGALTEGVYGASYSQTFSASGGTSPYSYAATGTLPPGLSLSAAGVLSGTPTAAGGPYDFTVTATDSASATASSSYSITIDKATPTVSTWPSASAIAYGQTLASSTLSGGAASVAGAFAWTTPSVAPEIGESSQNVTFTPTDASNYYSVTHAVSIQVNKPAATVNTWPSASAITYGQTLASSTLSGGSAAVEGSFAWTSPTTQPPVGESEQSVTFTPADDNYSAATGVTKVVVAGVPTSLSLASSSSSAMLTEAVTLTATVSTAAGSPTGSVAFSDGDSLLGTAPLSSGVATLSASTLIAGAHTITASYVGDDYHLASSSSSVSVTIIDLGVTVTSGSGSGSSSSGSGSSSGGSSSTTPSATVAPGGSTSLQVAITSSQSLILPVSTVMTVAGLPSGASATVDSSNWTQTASAAWLYPANVTLVNPTLNVSVPKTTAMRKRDNQRGRMAWWLTPALFGMLLAPFGGRLLGRRGKARRAALAIVLLLLGVAAMLTTTGCGSANGYFSTPEKTYTLTITVTAGAVSKVSYMTLYVQ